MKKQQPHEEQKRMPWPFPTHNGKPLLRAKREKFNPSKYEEAPF